MTNQLKTEIEKINQEIKDEEDEEWREVLKGKKQGLIQGAKMMIEEIKSKIHKTYSGDHNDNIDELLKQLNNWLEKEWNKIIKTIVGVPCLVFLIASGVPLMTNEGLSRLIGFFNYFGGSILLYFILYKYFKMEEELKKQLTTEGEGKE